MMWALSIRKFKADKPEKEKPLALAFVTYVIETTDKTERALKIIQDWNNILQNKLHFNM